MISVIISGIAVLVAVLAILSSSKDARKQIRAIKELCALQIDDAITILETECIELENINQNYTIQKQRNDKQNISSFADFNRDSRIDIYKIPIEENNKIINSLCHRIQELKKRKELLLK